MHASEIANPPAPLPPISPVLVVVLAADSTAVASADLFAAASRGNANEILIHLRPSRRVVYAKKAYQLGSARLVSRESPGTSLP